MLFFIHYLNYDNKIMFLHMGSTKNLQEMFLTRGVLRGMMGLMESATEVK